jgi:hypothetical protein
MNATRATGLGEPGPIGKKALFRPPAANRPTQPRQAKEATETDQRKPTRMDNGPRRTPKRVRITTELTGRALIIIQELQNQHRLTTGRALPLWKAVSEAIEYYGASKGGEEK